LKGVIMETIEIRNKYTNEVILSGKYESIKDCLEKNRGANLDGTNLGGANLDGAYLYGANLDAANLYGANLGGANLDGAKNYYMSHDFCMEIIKRQSIKTFTEKEWAILGQIMIHRICWENIGKRYGKKILPIVRKLAKCGFDEYLRKFKGEL